MKNKIMNPLNIIQKTDEWLVVNKPSGVSIHGDQEALGFVENLKQQLGISFLAPVHRLDKVTSGCLLLAKTSNAASLLSQQFQNQEVQKKYLAIVTGKMKKKQGMIKGDMLPSRRGSWRLTKTQNNPAITVFKSMHYQPGYRLVVIKPVTGKTHQIRVAMKSNSSPVWGDLRYGSKEKNQLADRCYLHCWQLSFKWLDNIHHLVCLPNEGILFKQTLLQNSAFNLVDCYFDDEKIQENAKP